jgi:hypothetical protein
MEIFLTHYDHPAATQERENGCGDRDYRDVACAAAKTKPEYWLELASPIADHDENYVN